MKRKNIFAGIITLLVIGIVGISISFAHGDNINDEYSNMGFGMMGYSHNSGYINEMHENMESILDNGTYSDLEQFREEYDVPMMYWVENNEDLESLREVHERYESNHDGGFIGGCHR